MSLGVIPITADITQISAAVSARTSISIYNDGLEPCFIKYDGSVTALTAANGEVLPPKHRLVLDSTAEISARCATGKATTLRVQDISTP